jgi:hypothetical protein
MVHRSRFGFATRVLAVALAVLGVAATRASAAELRVDGGSASCSDVAGSAQPLCTISRAAALAKPGDVVLINPGRYAESVRPGASGTASAPIRYVAAQPGVVIDAAGAATALKLIGVSHLSFEGLTVTGALSQGVWMDGAGAIVLSGMSVTGNTGAGVQIKASTGVEVRDSRLADNGSAGIFELAGTSGDRYVRNTIQDNGIGGSVYNGDGIQLGGSGAYVAGNTITGNGDPGPYEHGIYAGAAASGYVIESNVFSRNAAAGVKAAGTGIVRYNRFQDEGRYAVVASDNPAPVEVSYNLITGRYQHALFLTSGTTAARARIWNNTIVETGRSSDSGDASALFVNAADSLDFRNNVIVYDNADNLGVAFWVNDHTRLGSLTSSANWFFSHDASHRDLAYDGSRLTLAAWQARTGQDQASTAATAPSFDADWRLTAPAPGVALGLPHDFAGTPVPDGGQVDIGAFQALAPPAPAAAAPPAAPVVATVPVAPVAAAPAAAPVVATPSATGSASSAPALSRAKARTPARAKRKASRRHAKKKRRHRSARRTSRRR